MVAEETLAEHVALIGLPGAGKSVVAALLARSLGRPSVDLDQAVERAAGRPVSGIFADEGEERFAIAVAARLDERRRLGKVVADLSR